MRKLFGTDGIRGAANSGNMTAEVAMKLGMAAGSIFTRGTHRHRVIIGKDTRLSGYLLEPALTAGFVAVGMDVVLAGPLPTPAVAMLTRSMRADIGVMLSASHNLYQDNGIKLFGPDGLKLSDEVEQQIELRINGNMQEFLASSENLGRVKRLDDASGRYIEFVKNTFPKGMTLEGLKIVIDCANGAAYHMGCDILRELGAEVVGVAISPDGFNINHNCGSSYIALTVAEVKKHQADIGIALDGDADRVVIVDEAGRVVDGDQIMALIATSYHRKNKLSSNKIVATVMSNLGLQHYLNSLGLELVRTQVGDRYVAEQMRNLGANVGGEQSGHIILSDHTTTGDGLVAALHVLSLMAETGHKASQICNVFHQVPQILHNVICKDTAILENPKVQQAIAAGENKLHGIGRLLIRKSGTEPLIRIMAECENSALMQQIIADIALELTN